MWQWTPLHRNHLMIMTPGDAKKEQDANYIRLHPDAVQVSILGTKGDENSTIYGILAVIPRQDTSGKDGRKMIGNDKRLSIAADDAGPLKGGADGSKIMIAGKKYTVTQIVRQDEGGGYLTTLHLM